jgi:hypothetical protein
VESVDEAVQRIETVAGDTMARMADMAEQFEDAVRSIPAPVVNFPDPVTVRRVERDNNGRILRVIDEVS